MWSQRKNNLSWKVVGGGHEKWIRTVRLAYQPPVSSTFLSEQTSHQQSTNSIFLSK
jgi:hypothetical protein